MRAIRPDRGGDAVKREVFGVDQRYVLKPSIRVNSQFLGWAGWPWRSRSQGPIRGGIMTNSTCGVVWACQATMRCE